MIEYAADAAWGTHAVASFGRNGGNLDSNERKRLWGKPGEVVLVLSRGDGTLWLHTKEFYPDGVFRLPTGTLKESEAPDRGFERELVEETGLTPPVSPHRLARIDYRDGDRLAPFVSYLYLVEGVDARPQPVDTGERISDWHTARPDELSEVVVELETLRSGWESWGRFRAVAHEVVQRELGGGK